MYIPAMSLSLTSRQIIPIRSTNSSYVNSEPSNADIMTCVTRIDSKLSCMEADMVKMDKMLATLESPQKKVDGFNSDMNIMWTHIREHE